MADPARQIHDLLLLISYVRSNEGASVDAVAQHVIGVGHDDAVLGVDHGALVALDVQLDPCLEAFVRAVVALSVVGNSQEGAA